MHLGGLKEVAGEDGLQRTGQQLPLDGTILVKNSNPIGGEFDHVGVEAVSPGKESTKDLPDLAAILGQAGKPGLVDL